MKKNLWTGLFILIGVVLIAAWTQPLTQLGKPISSLKPAISSTPVKDIQENDWFKGGRDSQKIIIEYSDFQCPACGVYYPVVKKLNEEYGENIKIVYRHYPLRQIHLNAAQAAQAAEAAGRQGKFWQMHDLLFENQDKWSDKDSPKDTFLEYAKALNLDTNKFLKDFDSKEVKDKIESDYQSGVAAGVNATPTFFLNSVKLDNPRSYEELKKIIDSANE